MIILLGYFTAANHAGFDLEIIISTENSPFSFALIIIAYLPKEFLGSMYSY